jgi:molybdopterin/thiamine biosynthesis adenylyltransferase
VITIPSELLGGSDDDLHPRHWFFLPLDDGTVFNGLFVAETPGSLPGTIHYCGDKDRPAPTAIGKPKDIVRIIVRRQQNGSRANYPAVDSPKNLDVQGYRLRGDQWDKTPVQVVPVAGGLRSRTNSILETDLLDHSSVFQVGGGSGGAPIPIELAKCGVGRFELMDHDRLEVGNIWRHIGGLRDVGRFKTRFLAEAIRQKNPYAEVQTSEEKLTWGNEDLVRQIVRRIDLVISAVDDPDAMAILNKVCVEENKTLIIAGAFRRAYGGQILVVKPGVTPCYECFKRCLPQKAQDREISSTEQADRIAYSDRPVPIEPGLANDIAPVSSMAVKLALQELIKGKPTSLRSLDEDLVAPWYLWLNRREPNTEYATLEPLGFALNGMHILRWYGIALERLVDCPCCGDFVGEAAREAGFTISEMDTTMFAD